MRLYVNHMKSDMYAYWLGGAASMAIGAAVIGGMDFGPSSDIFSIIITVTASFLLMAFGGLLWMIGSARLGSE